MKITYIKVSPSPKFCLQCNYECIEEIEFYFVDSPDDFLSVVAVWRVKP